MNVDKPFIFDIETSINNHPKIHPNPIGDDWGASWLKQNQIVSFQWSQPGHNDSIYYQYYKHPTHKSVVTRTLVAAIKNEWLFVGHNIKYDLLYLMRDFDMRWALPHIQIWDTQLVEYIITGQTSRQPSLDTCAEKYNGTLKDDTIKEYWKNGTRTEDIPVKELKEYAIEDIRNTKLTYEIQLIRVRELGLQRLIASQMQGLKATIEMEYNGMFFDTAGANIEKLALSFKLDAISEDIKTVMVRRGIVDPNPSSNEQLSVTLFGGEIEVECSLLETSVQFDLITNAEIHEYVRYKTGQKKGEIKRKISSNKITIPNTVEPIVAKSKKGFYPVGEKELEDLIRKYKHISSLVQFCKSILEYRGIKKDITTYYDAYAALTWPDGIIHHHLNHCIAKTGRLTSSSPNLQNTCRREDD